MATLPSQQPPVFQLQTFADTSCRRRKTKQTVSDTQVVAPIGVVCSACTELECFMASQEVIKLLDFRMFRTDTLVWYSLQLSNGRECWVVTRRYSEFLRCHVKLLELFHREQLPTFPPKDL
eukprot:s152_g11.t1